MPKTRLEIQAEFESLLGTNHVYFQPPETIKIQYPCIVYSTQTVQVMHADNMPWLHFPEYLVSYIGKDPDDPMIEKLMTIPGFMFDRHYVSDNLHHNVYRYTVY